MSNSTPARRLNFAVRTRRGNDTQQRSHPHQAAPTDSDRIEITSANKFIEFCSTQARGFAGFGYRASEPLREWYCFRRSSSGSLLSITLHSVVARSRCRILGAHHKSLLESCSEFVASRVVIENRARIAVNSGLFDRVLTKSCLSVLERASEALRILAARLVALKNIFQHARLLLNFCRQPGNDAATKTKSGW